MRLGCEGTETVEVTVTGKTRTGPQGAPGGTGGATGLAAPEPAAPGRAPGSGGGGTDNTEFGAYPVKPERKPPTTKQARPEPHLPFSSDPASGAGKTVVQGILLSGAGRTITQSLSKGAPAGNPKPREGTQGVPSDPSRVAPALALTLAIMWLGALRERRRVRLRVA